MSGLEIVYLILGLFGGYFIAQLMRLLFTVLHERIDRDFDEGPGMKVPVMIDCPDCDAPVQVGHDCFYCGWPHTRLARSNG